MSDEQCAQDVPLVDESLGGLPGNLQWRSASRETLNSQIAQDEFVDQGGILLGLGETLTSQVASGDLGGVVRVMFADEIVAELEGGPFDDDSEWFAA